MNVTEKLRNLQLPPAPKPAANYAPYLQLGDLVYVSGQVPFDAQGRISFRGRVGDDLDLEQGYQAARCCGLNCLAQLQAAVGDLERVRQIVRVGGFVQCTADFTGHPKVINGVSDLLVEVFGDKIGTHARAAVGVYALPLGVAVEVELLAAVRP